ncbi:MAG: oxidoreductase [Chlamydiales bacterium 38-26]|nr:SDR family oxidoreductase [Chlamydiales bacterium]OJV11318.1 MAG: oxidoreductase [Chlamydiales bacterium 38-26]
MMKLKGKVALVTGGARGIGAAIVRALAEEGAEVAFSYGGSKDKAEALVRDLQAKGMKIQAFQANQADSEQVENLVKSVIKTFGRMDILINNAGVFVLGELHDTTNKDALENLWAVNVGGVVAAVKTASPFMKDGGRIVTIGSILANRIPHTVKGTSDYAATKAALAAYTRSWARELGPRGITVNVVQPGPIDTDMNPASSDYADMLRSLTALGRYGRPEEVAASVVFLASPDASYITGATLDVDGGNNA